MPFGAANAVLFPPFAWWGYGKSRPSSYTNSKQLRVCRLLGADFVFASDYYLGLAKLTTLPLPPLA
jgi:hypothetical protein